MNTKTPIEQWNDLRRTVEMLRAAARALGKPVYIEFTAPVVTPDPQPAPGSVIIDDFSIVPPRGA